MFGTTQRERLQSSRLTQMPQLQENRLASFFYAPTGVLFAMTTNHLEKLDEALLRPGRIDYKLYLGNASDRQKVELYRRFFPEASEAEAREFVEVSRSAHTMAEFQGLLLALEEGRLNPVATTDEVLARKVG